MVWSTSNWRMIMSANRVFFLCSLPLRQITTIELNNEWHSSLNMSTKTISFDGFLNFSNLKCLSNMIQLTNTILNFTMK